MQRHSFALIIALVLTPSIGTAQTATTTKRPMTFEDMMQMGAQTARFSVSPDGKWLGCTVTNHASQPKR